MLTKAKIAQQSGIPTTTVKYYMDKFAAYFPPHKEPGKAHPLYEDQAVEIVKRISELIARRKAHSEIEAELQREGFIKVFAMDEQPATSDHQLVNRPSSMDDPLPDLSQSIEAALQAVTVLNRMNDELGKTLAKQEKRLVERGKAIRRLYDIYERQNRTIKALEKRLES